MATTRGTKSATTKQPASSSKKTKDIEEMFRIRIEGHRIIEIQASIGSVPVVPVPPRPKKGELVVHTRIDEDLVLTIATRVTRAASAGPIVGGGPRPRDQ